MLAGKGVNGELKERPQKGLNLKGDKMIQNMIISLLGMILLLRMAMIGLPLNKMLT
jgi:hypothetical protein